MRRDAHRLRNLHSCFGFLRLGFSELVQQIGTIPGSLPEWGRSSLLQGYIERGCATTHLRVHDRSRLRI